MSQNKSGNQKFIYFLLGVGLPVAAYFIWSKTCLCSSKRAEVEEAYDNTVEDSFPASDPPSAW